MRKGKGVIAVCGDLTFPAGAQVYAQQSIEDLLGAGAQLAIWTPAKPETGPAMGWAGQVEWLVRPAFFLAGRGLSGKLGRVCEEFRFLRVVRTDAPEYCVVLADRPRFVYLFVPRRTRFSYLLHEVGPSCPGLPPHRFLGRSCAMCSRPPGLGCFAVDRREGCLGKRPLWRKLQSIARSMWAVWLVRRMRGAIANSRYTREMFKQGSHRFHPPVVHPPIVSSGDPIPSGDRSPASRFQIAFVGRVEEEKGVFEALDILARLPEPFTLTVIGDGSARQSAQDRADEAGLADRVRFVGWLGRGEALREIRKSGALIMPSLCAEGFGMAGAEALSVGTPVVAYDVGATPEWCQSPFARTVRVGDRQGVAARLLELTSDPEMWAARCREAQGFAQAKFDPARRRMEFMALVLGDADARGQRPTARPLRVRQD